MVLKVPFEKFAETAKRCAGGKEAYLTMENGQVIATASDPARGFLVASSFEGKLEAARAKLKDAGFEVHDGRWASDTADLGLTADTDMHIAAIAYRSGDTMPGLWVDAFPDPVAAPQALKALYDEFVENGEIGDVSFEEFLRIADANVVILSQDVLGNFAATKEQECD